MMAKGKQKALVKQISGEELIKTFGASTGSNVSKSGGGYPYINILQSDKQAEKFSDPENINMKDDYGKMYIRSRNSNSTKDLVSEIKGTIIKEQKGSELWVNGEQVYAKSNDTASQEEKDRVFGTHSAYPTNVIKMLIKLEVPQTLGNGEEYQFVMVTIKGSSWGGYFDLVEAQKKLVLESNEIGGALDAIHVCFWNLTLKTTKMEKNVNGQKRKWYAFEFGVELNSIDKAKGFIGDMGESESIDLIRIGSTNTVAEAEVVNQSSDAEVEGAFSQAGAGGATPRQSKANAEEDYEEYKVMSQDKL